MPPSRFLRALPLGLALGALLAGCGGGGAGGGSAPLPYEIWGYTADMHVQRVAATATVLLDGRVLVVGGTDASGRTATAEIFDPAYETWSFTGSLRMARSGHTATLLDDGSVLVVGGNGDADWALASAEVWTREGTWVPVGDMAESRTAHAATRLANGRVLVAGGYGQPYDLEGGYGGSLGDPDSRTFVRATCEVYDPNTRAWTRTGDLSAPIYAHTATLLPNGQVVRIGGATRFATDPHAPTGTGDIKAHSDWEVYDVGTGRWTPHAEVNTLGQIWHAATLPRTGASSWREAGSALTPRDTSFPSCSRWSWARPPLRTRSSAASPTEERAFPTATLLTDGTVLLAGGIRVPFGDKERSTSLVTSERYDPRDAGVYPGGWSATKMPMNEARALHVAARLPDGRVLVAGGIDYDRGIALSSAEIFAYSPKTAAR